ncbi:hypothetical protein BCR34DRAFT_677681 [Clohesyomyces aquaticus]|uniref:RING-type domain-containing protein n=1 Tax=Clohesyomyces aquaticus TaxID=1231657 RepID=A0A1Y1Y8E8_9PLEO|nr:hypothetical protein BCR34DRAFT_677681 [Clohesyomyces aquaticus]
MGTLTADCPRLDSHCPHKLATSCRLTSTPRCCACADERPHSRTYSVYIDGVGFVQRGTRWQSYCWFCKEFWNNRLDCTYPSLSPEQTQIPQIPDQTAFLERWFEFHQGYRIIKLLDGTEDRIAVTGEPLMEVSPGFLPRTLHQLRAGRANDHRREENQFERARLAEEQDDDEEGPSQSLEDALDNLMAGASDDEIEGREVRRDVQERERSVHERERASNTSARSPAGSSRPWSRHEILLQRARERLVRVYGTRDEIESDDYQSPISTLYTRAFDRYQRAENLRASGQTLVPPSITDLTPQERREIEQQLLWTTMAESREGLPRAPDLDSDSNTPVRSITPYPGTREEFWENLVADWQRLGNTDTNTDTPPATAAAQNTAATTATAAPSLDLGNGPIRSSSSPAELQPALDHLSAEITRLRRASRAVAQLRQAISPTQNQPRPQNPHPEAGNPSPEPEPHLDNQPHRPAPLSDGEMTKTLACQVCYCQLANIALLPCGHMVMCEWCAEVVVPVKFGSIPVRRTNCPMCRKEIKQKFKIHI